MKNTTRHKIGLKPAGGLDELCELPQRGPELRPKSFSTFHVSRG